ncbi:hypothetical protein PENVUL_c083G04908 [Penicillium vulpinum]|uniref:Uncharacterized protein n=1 Tax=Penicillium vulpinum TaxID=29845 RepID=A0A1V6R7R8_9EURO|nr:hypothetical protein PENVUL_c083G04908 [Penicillium vulpinum]
MSLPNSDEILQKTLEHVEHTVVEELKTWLDANPHAEWKQSPRFKLVEQCSEIKLREILQQLAQRRYFSDITLRLGGERRRAHSHILQ